MLPFRNPGSVLPDVAGVGRPPFKLLADDDNWIELQFDRIKYVECLNF